MSNLLDQLKLDRILMLNIEGQKQTTTEKRLVFFCVYLNIKTI